MPIPTWTVDLEVGGEPVSAQNPMPITGVVTGGRGIFKVVAPDGQPLANAELQLSEIALLNQIAQALGAPLPMGTPQVSIAVSNFPAPPTSIAISNLPAVEPFPTSIEVSNLPATPTTIEVSNFPTPPTYPTSIEVSNFPAPESFPTSIAVSNLPETQSVSGTIAVSNFPTPESFPTSIAVSNFPVPPAEIAISNVPVPATSIAISNLPATQPVSGTVAVDNFPPPLTSIAVSNFPAAPTSIAVSNFPAVQASIAVNNFPTPGATPSGTNLIGQVALTDGIKATYSASLNGATIATPAFVSFFFTLQGSSSKLIRLLRVGISGTQTSAGQTTFALYKLTGSATGGTPTAVVATPHDSNNPPASASVIAYGSGSSPTYTTSQQLRVVSLHMNAPATNTDSMPLEWRFGDGPGQGVVLRGATQLAAITLIGAAPAGASMDVYFEWSEE